MSLDTTIKTNNDSKTLKRNKQTSYVTQTICKKLTQWDFVTLGSTIKANDSSQTLE